MSLDHLNNEDRKRLAVLEEIASQLRANKHVQNRRLKTWLLPDEFASLSTAWSDEQQLRLNPADKPSVVVEYERRLKRANFVHAKAESASSKSRRNASKLSADADVAYGSALEYLIEHSADDPSLQLWFDRPLDWSTDGALSTDYVGMPRVITSRSRENQSDGSIAGSKQSKRDVKLAVVLKAIDLLKHPPPEQSQEQMAANNAQLKSMLNALKGR